MESTKTKKENRPPLNLSRPKSPEDAQNSNQGNEEEELKELRLVSKCFIFVKHLESIWISPFLSVRSFPFMESLYL